MKDDRKQRLLATICHVVRHLLGRFLDFEIHTVPSGYHRTISLFHFYRTYFMCALYGVLLRAHVPERGMWRDNKFSSCMDFHRIYVYVCRLLTAVAHYIYIRFIDQGFILNSYETMLNSWEITYKAVPGIDAYIEQLREGLSQVRSLTPIEITMQMMSMNVLWDHYLPFPPLCSL